jgi:uncharacterized protein YbjT (DUF2867 family)
MAYKAVIIGASGLIGSNLLNILLQQPEYDEILVLVRKGLPVKNDKLTQVLTDFDKIENYSEMITGHAVFSCLGSTKKKTPDTDQYRKIDHDYPLRLAQIAKSNGIKQFHLISAIGADAASGNFYLKMKGETEKDIKKIGLESLHIYQPSLLTGNRKESRLTERIAIALMKAFDPILFGGLKNTAALLPIPWQQPCLNNH